MKNCPSSNKSLRILVIRRDNIGDMICTTPLLRNLRSTYPGAYIAVLASSYNYSVLDGNPDVDEVYVFLKRQQKSHGYGVLQVLLHRWRLIRTLRSQRFDYILLANGGWRFARKLGGKSIVGFRERDNPDSRQPDVIVPLANRGRDDHEVRKMLRLGAAVGAPETEGFLALYPDASRVARVRETLAGTGWNSGKVTIAVHISSRQPVQRWPESYFVDFIRNLVARRPCQVVLLWAPGPENDPMHPGDDEKAARILSGLEGLPVFPFNTSCLQDLVAVLSLADQMVCSDGGAMHVAAALGKPILCFFGHSNRIEWEPWRVPHVLLQPDSKQVKDIAVEEALSAFEDLQTRLPESCTKNDPISAGIA